MGKRLTSVGGDGSRYDAQLKHPESCVHYRVNFVFRKTKIMYIIAIKQLYYQKYYNFFFIYHRAKKNRNIGSANCDESWLLLTVRVQCYFYPADCKGGHMAPLENP